MPYKKILNLIQNSYEMILEKKDDPKILFLDIDKGNLELLKKHLVNIDINSLGSDENNLLIYAIKRRENFNPDIINYLIEKNINIEHANRQSNTALLECLSQLKDYPIDKPYFINLAKTLIEKSSTKHLTHHLGLFGNSITTACVSNQMDLLRDFYEKGLTPSDIDFNYSNFKDKKDTICHEFDTYMIKEEKQFLDTQIQQTIEKHKHHKI
jgi:hypothetical protein